MIGELRMSLTEMQFCRIIHELEGRVEHLEQNAVDVDDVEIAVDSKNLKRKLDLQIGF